MRSRYTLALVALFLFPSIAYSATQFVVNFHGAEVVPPNSSTGTATAVLLLNDEQDILTGTLTWDGFVGATYHLYLRKAPAGVNGSLARDCGSLGYSTHGTQTLTIFMVYGVNVTDLMAGLYYLEMVSTAYPNGELRGQLVGGVVPSQRGTWGRIKSLYH